MERRDNKRSWSLSNGEPASSSTSSLSTSPAAMLDGGVILSKILSDHKMTWDGFLNDIWQTQPFVFSWNESKSRPSTLSGSTDGCADPTVVLEKDDAGRWRDEFMTKDPWREIVEQGWNIVLALLEKTQSNLLDSTTTKGCNNGRPMHGFEAPLIFQNQQVLSVEECETLYHNNLFGAYLDGASMVFNHADLLNAHLAFLCQDFQQKRTESIGFPHVYANCYLTPPKSQTAPPHADDRDVLIFQVMGKKQWQIYSQVPIPYPYPHEQVGKDGMEVPSFILQGHKAFDDVLYPGDILYVPRGMVHQAQSTDDSLSFHITVAIATHDWTLARNMSRLIEATLMRIVDYRTSIVPFPGTDRAATIAKIQDQINNAFQTLQKEVTPQIVVQDIEGRIDNHNREAFSDRMSLIHSARVAGGIDHGLIKTNGIATENEENTMSKRVGSVAASSITYTSIIRAATPSEKAYAQSTLKCGTSSGLNVREEIADAVMKIISTIKVSVGTNQRFQVANLRSVVENPCPQLCDLTLLCLAKRTVELGVCAVVV
ncbi:cupin 4 family protein [Nitzschia inconspicua]|uniref:Bifunctional lysine-specific demethylase and histidyl-hydroxylase n=1 Tax=Nitzschia inconspicua TaxID=303405 RepID=A0A9K3L3C6_9STRA|nr:cupin 4 family protein [Nitzschia inconspicua]